MKVKIATSKEFLIWSMLDGDHALANNIRLLNQDLILKPDFSSFLENKLREVIFNSKRQYISDYLKDSSVVIANFSFEELLSYESCYTSVSFEQFLDSYELSVKKKKGFTIVRKSKDNIEKSVDAINDIEKRVDSLNSWLTANDTVLPKLSKVSSHNVLNSKNIWVATNRIVVCKTKNGTIKIIDGTHRLLSFGLLKNSKKINCDSLYGFYFEEKEE